MASILRHVRAMVFDDDGTGAGRDLGQGFGGAVVRRPGAAMCGGLRSIALLGSHGPRPGGLATFTVELGEAMTREWPGLEHVVIAVNDRTRQEPIPPSVRFAVAPGDVSAYRRAADFVNVQDVDLLAVQYEDGLHGGPGGMYLLALLRELHVPVVTIIHTIAVDPDRVQRDVMSEIVRRSERLVVTSARAAQVLREVHGVRPEKIDHVPGGGEVPSPAMARAYGRCFERARADHSQRRWQSADQPRLADRLLGVPALELAHVSYLTDEAGIQAHRHGDDHCGDHLLDDNARALAVMAWLEQLSVDDRWTVSVLASRYLSFVADAFDPERSRFRGRMAADGDWSTELASEDSHARALWALGTVVGRARDRGRCHFSAELFRAALAEAEGFTSPLAQAYALLGLAEYQRAFAIDPALAALQRALARRLIEAMTDAATAERPWLAGDEGGESPRIAQALLVSGERFGDPAAVAMGARALQWLVARQRATGGPLAPRGEVGGGPLEPHRPADVAATVSACLTALRITGEEPWAEEAGRAYAWFLGANSAGRAVYVARTGACHDAVVGDQLDPRQGAEAVASFLQVAAEIRLATGAVADQLPCDLRSLARGTGSHARQVRAQLLASREPPRTDGGDPTSGRAEEHVVSPPHTDPASRS